MEGSGCIDSSIKVLGKAGGTESMQRWGIVCSIIREHLMPD